jgi:signal transduction histidine kinase
MIARELRILIIDDSPEDREVLRRQLMQDSEYTYHFFEEETGEQGLEACKSIRPDCILLDYGLPDIDGLEFLRELIDGESTMPFPVVMLTGLGDEAVAIQAMKSGAQDYLVKGKTSPESLHRAVHNALERVDMLRTMDEQRRILEKKNQELQAFAYALAHDLRSPLRAIGGFGQILAQEQLDRLDEEGKHYVQSIVKASMQMDHLIDDLLSYTKIEHRAVRHQPVALYTQVMQVVNSLLARLEGVEVEVTVPENLPVIEADPTLISQIFINLIDNALTYRRPGIKTEVVVSCEVEPDGYIIRVHDNGIGIAPKHYEKIFNIFQRLHGEDEYPGTGIGLAIVKKSAELMNGEVWVESVVGEGSTFCVRLPH